MHGLEGGYAYHYFLFNGSQNAHAKRVGALGGQRVRAVYSGPVGSLCFTSLFLDCVVGQQQEVMHQWRS